MGPRQTDDGQYDPAYEMIRLDPDCDTISMMVTKPGQEDHWWAAVYVDAVAWEDEYKLVDHPELCADGSELYDPARVDRWLRQNVKEPQWGWYKITPEACPEGDDPCTHERENDVILPAAEGDAGAIYGAFVELKDGVE